MFMSVAREKNMSYNYHLINSDASVFGVVTYAELHSGKHKLQDQNGQIEKSGEIRNMGYQIENQSLPILTVDFTFCTKIPYDQCSEAVA